MANKTKSLMMFISSTLLFSGCTSMSTNDNYMNNGGLTVEQIYKQTLSDNERSAKANLDIKRKLAREFSSTNDVRRRVSNKEVDIYVYPHIAQVGEDEIYRPGYKTAFNLYKKNRLALKVEND